MVAIFFPFLMKTQVFVQKLLLLSSEWLLGCGWFLGLYWHLWFHLRIFNIHGIFPFRKRFSIVNMFFTLSKTCSFKNCLIKGSLGSQTSMASL